MRTIVLVALLRKIVLLILLKSGKVDAGRNGTSGGNYTNNVKTFMKS